MIDFSALSDDVFSQNDQLLELLAFDSVMWSFHEIVDKVST